jgi:hypothetical protein
LENEELASAPFMGGLMNNGYQCGLLWGAALAAGAQAYRDYGPGEQAEVEAILVTRKLLTHFRERNKNQINCYEISEMHFKGSNETRQILKFLLKGGPIGCLGMAAGYTQQAYSEIYAAQPDQYQEKISPPISCAAMLVESSGYAGLHPVMAAGLAGGIGLSGGACGALGAAIWLIGLNQIESGGNKMLWISEDFQSRANNAVEQFIQIADDFECAAIVGREFEDVPDHAAFLADGGCAEIIEMLAGVVNQE